MENCEVIRWREPYWASVRRRCAWLQTQLVSLPHQLWRAGAVGVICGGILLVLFVRDVYHLWPDAPSPWAVLSGLDSPDAIDWLVLILFPTVGGLGWLFSPGRRIVVGTTISIDGRATPACSYRDVQLSRDRSGTRWISLNGALRGSRESEARCIVAPSVDEEALRARLDSIAQWTSGSQVCIVREPGFANVPILWRTRLLPTGVLAIMTLATLIALVAFISASDDPCACLTCAVWYAGALLTCLMAYVWIIVQPRSATVFERALHISGLEGASGWADGATLESERGMLSVEYRNRRGRPRRTRFIVPADSLTGELQHALERFNSSVDPAPS